MLHVSYASKSIAGICNGLHDRFLLLLAPTGLISQLTDRLKLSYLLASSRGSLSMKVLDVLIVCCWIAGVLVSPASGPVVGLQHCTVALPDMWRVTEDRLVLSPSPTL